LVALIYWGTKFIEVAFTKTEKEDLNEAKEKRLQLSVQITNKM